ncbi:MAG: ABC transporter permease subunit [Dehalococcoidales bacterium]|jgi:NitT/TauT family transport system permease protein/sulfonate transport system permease protein|nr:ABC transporter permease subunit [Dehalococcoidales bacterium]MDD4322359.1 ABC transporter permease subunit [Dehalococcoidales bacterium]MDD4794623.1 ABC transporter permease subunit [Dehalococcoidales bacterium]MDD5122154.1 ABC transporter permease subunit [Dehalococcoidales bacterium]MDD5498265.1 ABC transporter permease subunit [Dehalococcoidales bacterium]
MVKKAAQVVIATIIFWLAWWGVAEISNSALFPTPWQTLDSLWGILTSTNAWGHIGISTYRVLAGVAIGSAFGAIVGLSTRYWTFMAVAVQSVIYPLLQSVPTICWALIFVLWFGLADITPILAVATSVAPFFIINIWEGLKELDSNLTEMASVYTDSRWRVLGKVIMPMLYPYIFAATRSSLMVAWKVVILGEIFGAASGMGYMLSIAYGSYRIEQVFGWTLAFAIILIIFDYGIFSFIDRKYIRKWKPQET